MPKRCARSVSRAEPAGRHGATAVRIARAIARNLHCGARRVGTSIMPRVTYRQANGAEDTIDVAVGASVMDGAVDHGISGIRAQCGGASICATCHCYVDEHWLARLNPPDGTEREMLDFVWEPQTNSRLACQIRMREDLDGLVVEVPERQI